MKPETPAERRAFLLYCADLDETEARARTNSPHHVAQPVFVADLLESAARDRAEAALSLTPAQGDLFQ